MPTPFHFKLSYGRQQAAAHAKSPTLACGACRWQPCRLLPHDGQHTGIHAAASTVQQAGAMQTSPQQCMLPQAASSVYTTVEQSS